MPAAAVCIGETEMPCPKEIVTDDIFDHGLFG
jgi:hypothetical protein